MEWATQILRGVYACTERTTSAPTSQCTYCASDKIGAEPWARGGMGPSAQQNPLKQIKIGPDEEVRPAQKSPSSAFTLILLYRVYFLSTFIYLSISYIQVEMMKTASFMYVRFAKIYEVELNMIQFLGLIELVLYA